MVAQVGPRIFSTDLTILGNCVDIVSKRNGFQPVDFRNESALNRKKM